jgi:hypothetical protein
MIIKKFKLFLEARLADLLNIKGDSDLAKEISILKDSKFDISKKLVKFITLNQRVNNKKIQFQINWNDTAKHNLTKRIEKRTSFGSVEEFNNYFKDEFNKIFPEMVGKELFKNGVYSLCSKNYNFSIIMYFNIDKYINGNYQVNILTILPGIKGENIIRFIDIL